MSAKYNKYPVSLFLFAAAFTALLSLELVVYLHPSFGFAVTGLFVAGVVMTVLTLAGIAAGGYWLHRSPIPSTRYRRIGRWVLGGAVGFTGINGTLALVMPGAVWILYLSWLRWAAVFGGGIGLLIGVIEGRAIHRAITAERAAVQAEQLEEQRDLLDYLNSILRHEILNSTTIIHGYASRLAEAELDDQHGRCVTVILEESEEMSQVVDDVRVLLALTTGDHELEPVNLSRVLRTEIRKLDTRNENVSVAASIQDELVVHADDLLPRVFGNLLSNAVQHNDATTPHVRVAADRTTDAVRVEIEDDGPGIPEEKRESLFVRENSHGSTHGLGLYLVDMLVSNYDGTVELTETGPDGSVFTVEFPRPPATGALPETRVRS